MPAASRFHGPLSLLVSVLLATAATAEPRFTFARTQTTADCRLPSLVSPAPITAMLAWEEAGHVWTDLDGWGCTTLPLDIPPTAYDHGPGTAPTIGMLPGGLVVLAFFDGADLIIRESDGSGAWATPVGANLGDASPVGPIDLWCSGDPQRPAPAWLTFWSGSGENGGIRFLQRGPDGWGPLQTVPVPDTGFQDLTFPQATEHDGPDGPLPRICFVTLYPEVSLSWTDLDAEGRWSTPDTYSLGHFGGDFDVARTADGYAFLTTGMQPTCPCNRICFEEWTETGGWSPSIDMTVSLDAWDWPLSPQVGVNADGGVHVSWYQLGSDAEMNGRHRRLHHRRRDDGIWTDLDDGLADQRDKGISTPLRMSIDDQGRAAFAWTRRDTVDGIAQPARVWVSYFDYCAMDAGDPPAAGLRVAASPNPFNPATTITALADDEVAAIEIHDARGRRIATLVPRREDGFWKAEWNGCDDAGRPQPSGLYLARVRDAAGAAAACKLVLAR